MTDLPAFAAAPTRPPAHDDRSPAFTAVSWALTALASVLLGLRLYCKLFLGRRLWWDDWILIAAWVMLIADDTVTTVLVHDYKLGRHSWDMEMDDPVRFTLLLGSRATVTITALVWAKTAFAVTLLRLTEGYVRHLVWFIIVTMNLAMGYSAAVPWVQCSPLAKAWDATLPGTCWARGVGVKIWIATGAYSALMDFALAALPWTFLRHLRMRRTEKIGTAVAMSMGVVAGAVAVVKCIKLPSLESPDGYDATELFMWDITEGTATMMAACIPTLRVLIRDAKNSDRHYETSNLESITITSPQVQQLEQRRGQPQRHVAEPVQLIIRDGKYALG